MKIFSIRPVVRPVNPTVDVDEKPDDRVTVGLIENWIIRGELRIAATFLRLVEDQAVQQRLLRDLEHAMDRRVIQQN